MQGKLCRMSIIKINALTVPEGQGPELEKRFDARKAHQGDPAEKPAPVATKAELLEFEVVLDSTS